MNQNTLTLFRALGNLAQAGAAAALSQQGQPTSGKRKRKRKTDDDDCSPCAAMEMVDNARERIREGKL